MNCPFYGRAMYLRGQPYEPPFLLLDTKGNQCALVVTSQAPCRMETNGQEPDWKACVLVKDMRMEADD